MLGTVGALCHLPLNRASPTPPNPTPGQPGRHQEGRQLCATSTRMALLTSTVRSPRKDLFRVKRLCFSWPLEPTADAFRELCVSAHSPLCGCSPPGIAPEGPLGLRSCRGHSSQAPEGRGVAWNAGILSACWRAAPEWARGVCEMQVPGPVLGGADFVELGWAQVSVVLADVPRECLVGCAGIIL